MFPAPLLVLHILCKLELLVRCTPLEMLISIYHINGVKYVVKIFFLQMGTDA